MLDRPSLSQDSPAWIFFVHAAFVIALTMMCIGIWWLPVDRWIRGYLAMGLFFTIAATLTLSKTLRDNHETKKLINRVEEVKTEKMLGDYALRGQ